MARNKGNLYCIQIVKTHSINTRRPRPNGPAHQPFLSFASPLISPVSREKKRKRTYKRKFPKTTDNDLLSPRYLVFSYKRRAAQGNERPPSGLEGRDTSETEPPMHGLPFRTCTAAAWKELFLVFDYGPRRNKRDAPL